VTADQAARRRDKGHAHLVTSDATNSVCARVPLGSTIFPAVVNRMDPGSVQKLPGVVGLLRSSVKPVHMEWQTPST
jgi:hypothetical protein